MKHYIIALIIAIAFISPAKAQRMLPGQKGLEIYVGALSNAAPEKNYYLGLGISSFRKGGHYWLGALEYTREESIYKGTAVPLESYFGEGGYNLRVLGDARRWINLYASLSGVVGYETINRGQNLLYDGSLIRSSEGFAFGAGGRLSLETYLCERMVLLLQGRVRMLWGTSMDQFRPSAGLGLRFNF